MFKIILTIGSIQVLAIAVNFVRTKVVAVMLGPEGVGVVSLIDQVVQSVSYFSALSLPFASIKFLSKAYSENDEAFRRVYASFFKGLSALAGAGTIIAVCLVLFRPEFLGAEIVKYRILLLVAILGVPTMVLGGFFTNVFAAAQKFRQSSLLAVITNSATTIAIVIGIMTAGITGLYFGSLIAGFLVPAGVIVYLRKTLNLPLYERGASFVKELRRNSGIISFSFLIYLATFTYSLGFLVVRYTVLKNYGEADAGLLQAGIALSLAVGLVMNPANGLYLTPIMNRNIEKSEKISAAIEFEKKFAIILLLISMPVILFPSLILIILFSAKFVVAAQFVFIFVVSQFVAQMAGVHQALLIGFDDLKAYSVITCIGHISLGMLSWLLAPNWGISGVASAFVVAYMFIFTATFIRLSLKHGFSLPFKLWLMLGYGAAALFLAGSFFVKFDYWSVDIIVLRLVILAGFSLSFLFFLNKEESASVYGALAGFKLKRSES